MNSFWIVVIFALIQLNASLRIKSVQNGECIDLHVSAGDTLKTQPCKSTNDQRFELKYIGAGQTEIVCEDNNECVDYSQSGDTLKTQPCNNNNNDQKWEIIWAGSDDRWQIKSDYNNECIDLCQSCGDEIHTNQCSSTKDQLWKFIDD